MSVKPPKPPMTKPIYIQPDFPHYFTVIYQDVFHLKSLYILIYEWLMEEGWTSCQGNWEEEKGDKNPETTFYDSRDPGNKKLWVWWRLQKKTNNSYYHYFMNINFMFLGWKDVEKMPTGSPDYLRSPVFLNLFPGFR